MHGGEGRIYVYCTIKTALHCSTGGLRRSFNRVWASSDLNIGHEAESRPDGRMEGIVEHDLVMFL